MSIKNPLFPKDRENLFRSGSELHHAYLITGDIKDNLSRLCQEIEGLIGRSVAGHPDFYSRLSAVFTIADSRELVSRQKTNSFSDGGRFFVVGAESFTAEAQNGLLKVLEEPIAGHHFFVLASNEEVLLPTLRSRLMHIRGEKLAYDELRDWCGDFVGADLTTRMVMIDKFLKEADKDDEEKLVRHKTRDVLNQLEKIFSKKISAGEATENIANFLIELLKMKEYLNDTAPVSRLILEYIAFICPF